MSKQEKEALRSLQDREDIVIKPADKGGAVCVWSRDLYIQEGHGQLQNTAVYKELPEDTTESVVKVIKELVSTDQLPVSALNLIIKVPRCSRFYLLPKVHKHGYPGRPVVYRALSITSPNSLVNFSSLWCRAYLVSFRIPLICCRSLISSGFLNLLPTKHFLPWM